VSKEGRTMADVQATDGEIDRQISSLHKHAFFLKIPVFRRDCNRTEFKHFVCLKNVTGATSNCNVVKFNIFLFNWVGNSNVTQHF
jgi:hypothetical protein